ncbi:MAG: hypothetical protein K2X11_03975 [Acetobacteraceae bacterium]|nr:hypothetical protein [Acetobacteraceae bacterium]
MAAMRVSRLDRLDGLAPEDGELVLHFVEGPEDGDPISEGHQAELQRFAIRMEAGRTGLSPIWSLQKALGSGSWLTGEFLGQVAGASLPVISAVAVAWLQARAGRKVRLKVGDIEAEARTPADLREILALAQDLKKNETNGG